MPGGVTLLDFDAAAFDALDAEIRSVFDETALITPDRVQGDHPTLRDAVLAGGWPRLGKARGKAFCNPVRDRCGDGAIAVEPAERDETPGV